MNAGRETSGPCESSEPRAGCLSRQSMRSGGGGEGGGRLKGLVHSRAQRLAPFPGQGKHTCVLFEPGSECMRFSARTAGWATRCLGDEATAPRCPTRGGRGRALRGWSCTAWISTMSSRKLVWGWGGRPLLFQARWQRGLPHLALSVLPLRLRLAFHRARGTFSICTASPAFLPGSQVTFHSQKNRRDLQMCEPIRRKKARWKMCSEKEQAGVGAQETLPRFSPPPHTPAGEPSICCVGSQAQSGLLRGGRG